MMMFRLMVTLMLFGLETQSFSDGAEEQAIFTFGHSVEALGMGEAQTAIAKGPEGVMYNASAAAKSMTMSLYTMKAILQDDSDLFHLALGGGINAKFGFSISWTQQLEEGIELIQPDSLGLPGDSSLTNSTTNALHLSLSHKMRGIYYGIVLRGFSQEYGDKTLNDLSGIWLDLGSQTEYEAFSFGLSLRNIPLESVSETEPNIIMLRTGTAYQMALMPILFSLDLSFPLTEADWPFYFIGASWQFVKLLSLNLGLAQEELTYGLSLNTEKISIYIAQLTQSDVFLESRTMTGLQLSVKARSPKLMRFDKDFDLLRTEK